MKTPITALFIFVVFVSGCISDTGTIQTGNGVIIKDYDIEFSDVYGGECIDFAVLIKNVGSVKAEQVFAEMLGLDEDWRDDEEITWGRGCKNQDGGVWSGKEKRANEPDCRFDAFKSTSEGGSGGYSITLEAPDPSRGVDGEERFCTWTYMAPYLPKGADITYRPSLRVFYTYSTDVVKAVTIMTKDEMKNLIEQNNALLIDAQSSTSSPVRIDVKTSTPIRMYADSIEFPIEIDIENVGGGLTCIGQSRWDAIEDCRASQEPEKVWRKLQIEIEVDNGIELSEECDGIIDIDMYKGKKNTITCMATVDDIPAQRIQKKITVHARYNYFIDQEIEITVHGNA